MWTCDASGPVLVARVRTGSGFRIDAPDLWSSLDLLISPQADRAWVVDLAEVRLLTSDALAAIVNLLRKVQAAGGRIAFARAQPGVANVIRSMRLTRLISLHPEIAEAMRGLLDADPVG